MSWGFKALSTLTEPATDLFVTLDPSHPGGMRPRSLQDDHQAAAELSLPESVPQSVRDYFDAARMLWVYGWFYYPFYSLAAVHAGLCVEAALRRRFETEGITLARSQSSLKGMLDDAIERRWLRAEGFGTIRRRTAREAEWAEHLAQLGEDPSAKTLDSSAQAAALEAGMRRLIEHVRYFRNVRAHPEGLLLLLPNMSYSELEFVRDLIAQLFSTLGPQPSPA